LETGFSTTGHSAVLTWLPMSLPTHFSVVVRDETANYSYAEDQTIGATPDGTMISYPSTAKIVNAYGEWSVGDLFAGNGVFRVLLNGKYVAQIQNVPGDGLGPSSVAGVYSLWIDHGGFVYVYINGDDGYAMYANGGWIGSGDSTQRFAPVAGYTMPTNFNPPYANTADGTSITAPTSNTLTNSDGVWGISGGEITLNGIVVVNNRSGNNNSYPPPGLAVSTLTIDSNGTIFAQMSADSSWRSMAGLAPNPSIGPTSSPVPISITVTPANGQLVPQTSHTSPINTPVASLTMTLSDGTVVVPGNGEVTLRNDVGYPGGITCAYSSPNLVTSTTGMTAGTADAFLVQTTRNGTSFCLMVSVYFP